jgi:hypothetical protein
MSQHPLWKPVVGYEGLFFVGRRMVGHVVSGQAWIGSA